MECDRRHPRAKVDGPPVQIVDVDFHHLKGLTMDRNVF